MYRLYEKFKKNNTTNEICNDTDQVLSENNIPPSHEVINNLELTKGPENSVEVKQLSISPIESVLIWPQTPERKGTRITERIPFVISSQKWQTLYEEKEKKKE